MRLKYIIFAICLIFLFSFSIIALIQDMDVQALRYTGITELSSNGNLDASFLGINAGEQSGLAIAGVGDVNGDGYDDLLIRSRTGETYLIFGKSSGWKMNEDLSNASASYSGKEGNYYSSIQLAGLGDVNGDGYDDFMIMSHTAYKAYLIFGKASGWQTNADLSTADSTFIISGANEFSYLRPAGAGDVNGDGLDDILIGVTGKAYLFFGKISGWETNIDILDANVIFMAESSWDRSDYSVAGAGDVNGDGYDDLLIGAWQTSKIYLVFGKPSGWSKEMYISSADASFKGEKNDDCAGMRVDGAGDINGDGFDDILIGAQQNDEGSNNGGQIYIIFGKTTGWALDMSLSNADASYLGTVALGGAGWSLAGVGDVNGDGFDDILIGDPQATIFNDKSGESYLILGKASGWKMDVDLSKADASFKGQIGYMSGNVAGAGDVNGDGYDDIIIGAYGNDANGIDAGATFLIFPDLNAGPVSVNSIRTYSDAKYSKEISKARVLNTIFIEMDGTDGDPNRSNIALIKITSEKGDASGFQLRLYETGPATGKFRGQFKVNYMTHAEEDWIKALPVDKITLSCRMNSTIQKTIQVFGIFIMPHDEIWYVLEDESFNQKYSVHNSTDFDLKLSTNASWLTWASPNAALYGTPSNKDIGAFWVQLIATDHLGNQDMLNYTLKVINTAPKITTKNINISYEDREYFNDYNCTDDNQGFITWVFDTNASWLKMNQSNGQLYGTPSNNDVGVFSINITVYDGNGGWDRTNFKLKVINKNDPPVINSTPVLEITLGSNYTYDVNATDVDRGDILNYSLVKGPPGMRINSTTGIIIWTPLKNQTGKHEILVEASDFESNDTQTFTIEVTSKEVKKIGLDRSGWLMVLLIVILLITALIFLGGGRNTVSEEKIVHLDEEE